MYITCFTITFILGTVGNGLVIWITGFKMKKTMTTIWFLNLAITDFSFCLILPLFITEKAMWGNWPFGQIMCKVTYFTRYLNLCTSVLLLTAISIDRCVCVMCPIWSRNHRTSRSAAIISAIIWFFSMAAGSPLICFSNILYYRNFSECSLTYEAWENIIDYETYSVIMIAFGITTFVLYFLIPFLFITICYGLIAFKVFKSKRIPGSARTLKMIITTAFCFFFCWFLLYLLCIIEIAGPNIMRHHLEMTLYTLAQCLAFFNSCLNPIIYVFTGRDYKQILKKSIPFLLESAFIEKREPAHI
uniref:G-protein coupled receptors family 1 profile domain-containing protein n=1 Tax=Xenopus tropicalis TaxID=8364 RepID=A0A1B8XXQ4_XENTR